MENTNEQENTCCGGRPEGCFQSGPTSKEERVAWRILLKQFIDDHVKEDSDGVFYLIPEDIEEFLGEVRFRNFQEWMAGRTVIARLSGIGIFPKDLKEWSGL